MKWLKRIKPHNSDAITEGKIYPVVEELGDNSYKIVVNDGSTFITLPNSRLWEVIGEGEDECAYQ